MRPSFFLSRLLRIPFIHSFFGARDRSLLFFDGVCSDSVSLCPLVQVIPVLLSQPPYSFPYQPLPMDHGGQGFLLLGLLLSGAV